MSLYHLQKSILSDGKEINSVSGERVKFMTSGIVDSVVVVKNRDGLRNVKFVFFKNKIPDVGDKYASRCTWYVIKSK